MQNADRWKPSKYVRRDGRLAASQDLREVGPGSRLVTDITAGYYDQLLRLHARGRLLDLGCGKVPLYASYRDRVTEATCVDWGKSLHRNEHLDFELDLTQPLPFPDGAFDTIILSDVLEHLPTPADLWSEMTRMLAPGGKLIMNVPFYYWLHEQPHDFYRYTEFALRRFAGNSRLDVVFLESVGGSAEVLADVLAKNLLRVPTIGRSLSFFVQWTAWKLRATGFGRKVLDATRADFPFGYFMVVQKAAA